MQDAIYKPHQISDEVFLILYGIEQPFRPVLFKTTVVGIDRQKNSTLYHVQPTAVIGSIPDIFTIRCISMKTKKSKEITMVKDTKFNWVQEFANKHEDFLFEAPQNAVFETKADAVNMINKLNNNTIQRINNEVIELLKQNTELNGI